MPAKKTTPKRNTEGVTNSDLKKAVAGWRRDASPEMRGLLDAEPMVTKPAKKPAKKKRK